MRTALREWWAGEFILEDGRIAKVAVRVCVTIDPSVGH